MYIVFIYLCLRQFVMILNITLIGKRSMYQEQIFPQITVKKQQNSEYLIFNNEYSNYHCYDFI